MLRVILTIRDQLPKSRIADALYMDARPAKRELRRGIFVERLPYRQWRVAQVLAYNHPTPMTHWEIFYHVWGEGSEQQIDKVTGGPLAMSASVVTMIAEVRKKLQRLGITIVSLRKGFGYQLMEIEDEQQQRVAGLGNGTPPPVSGDIVDRHQGLRLST